MGRVEGKVALVTGAARGQGRSHAVRLAEEGADIIAVDICKPIWDGIPLAEPEDLAETVRLVETLGRRIRAFQADVRDLGALTAAVDEGVSELGGLDIVAANAGTRSVGPVWEMPDHLWRDVIDVNLTGAWHTTRVATPHMIAQGRGGSIVLTGSTASQISYPWMGSTVASKHGILGLAGALALELGEHMIRVNAVLPTSVRSSMRNPEELDEQARALLTMLNALPVPWVEAVDVSNAVVFLSSDDARYITGIGLPVDAGMLSKTASMEGIQGMWGAYGEIGSGAFPVAPEGSGA